jgi:sugar phosphate permease
MIELSERAKGIFSVISAVFINIVCGSLYSWSGINGYYISYLKHLDSPSIEIKDGYFFMPIITFSTMCFSPLVTIINEKKGIKIISLISTILIILTNIALYYSTNITYVYVCMILYGIINAMNYMPVIKNCLLYFPKKKGLINGLVLFGYGTSSLIYNSIADYLINPFYRQINSSTGYFDTYISKNVIKYLLFFNIFNGIMAIISFLLLFEYRINPKKDKERFIQKNIEEKYEDIDDNNIEAKESKIREKDKYKYEKEEIRISLKEAFIQAIKGIQIYQLLVMSTILQIVSFTISNTYRSFAQQCLMEEYFLSNLNRLYSILSGISRLIWGYLFDKFTFKSLYSICIITQAIVDSILYNSVHYPILFFFLVCFQGVMVSGKISLNVTMFTKVYGIKYFGFIYSVSTSLGGFCHLLGPFIIKIVVKKVVDYKKLFIGGSIGCLICLVILVNFSEEKFKYKINEEEKEKELKDVLNKS